MQDLKLVFITPYPIEGPSSRFRVYQYLPHLEKRGAACLVRPFMTSRFYRIAYQPGRPFLKLLFLITGTINRILDLFRVMGYDMVIIQKEAFPVGPPILEWLMTSLIRKPCIYDFDDAIHLRGNSPHNRLVGFLKAPSKTSKIIRMCNHTVAGNNYLGDYAQRFTDRVVVISTPIDTDKYHPQPKERNPSRVILGWIGSHTTAQYLLPLKVVFSELKKRNAGLEIKLVGVGKLRDSFPEAICVDWKLEEEISSLRSFDIGIMPLPDTEWAKGKCGFKIIQYMAVGLPVVCSPVGMNNEIVIEGYNGFLAQSQDEWIGAIQKLLDNSLLREKLGQNGRNTVESKFSLKGIAPLFENTIVKAYDEAKHNLSQNLR